MTKEVGTLIEIGARVGDVVGIHGEKYKVRGYDNRISRSWTLERDNGDTFKQYGEESDWSIIRRANQPFNTLTAEEKGELMLSNHEGKIIEMSIDGGETWERSYTPQWIGAACYRVKADEVKEVVMTGIVGDYIGFDNAHDWSGTHRITFNLVNGKPDCASVKMEEL